MDKLKLALEIAARSHAGQKYGTLPYMYHIDQCVDLARVVTHNESVWVAAALHDTLEDTDLKYSEILETFGLEIAEAVYAVTDELGRNRKERKMKTYPKIKGNNVALQVKLIDRICNVRAAKRNNPDLLKMYVKEQKEFHDSLFEHKDDNHYVTQSLWLILTKELAKLHNPIQYL